jgi:hypothetical protein
MSRLRNSLWLAGRSVKRWLNPPSQSAHTQAETVADHP